MLDSCYKNIVLPEIQKNLCDTTRRVLHVCCGDGQLYDRELVAAGYSVTGIDISSKRIEQARRNCPTENYIVADFLKCSTQLLDMFDAVICEHGLNPFECENQRKTLQKMYDFLNCDGLCFISVNDSAHTSIKEVLDWSLEMGFRSKVYRVTNVYSILELTRSSVL